VLGNFFFVSSSSWVRYSQLFTHMILTIRASWGFLVKRGAAALKIKKRARIEDAAYGSQPLLFANSLVRSPEFVNGQRPYRGLVGQR
jgi:hypothetical protein